MNGKASKKKKSGKQKTSKEETGFKCPVYEALDAFGQWSEETCDVFHQTKIEFLKAIRSLIDRKIDAFEKKGKTSSGKGRVQKIEIED